MFRLPVPGEESNAGLTGGAASLCRRSAPVYYGVRPSGWVSSKQFCRCPAARTAGKDQPEGQGSQ
jgi:hypothetical protein